MNTPTKQSDNQTITIPVESINQSSSHAELKARDKSIKQVNKAVKYKLYIKYTNLRLDEQHRQPI